MAGSYRPTNVDDVDDDFPAPAPSPTGTPALSVFDGTAPQGTWRLFAYDPYEEDLVRVDDWTLDIEYVEKVAPSGSVSIAGGAAGTRTPGVTLNLSATDPQPGSGISDMRLSNDGTTFSAFRFYAATLPWTLAPGDGTKTVYVQYRDADGNLSPVVSDTIVLDTTAPTARKLRPKSGADDVARGATIKMWSSEALAAATVTKANVVLKTDGHRVKVKVTYLAGRQLVKVEPEGVAGAGALRGEDPHRDHRRPGQPTRREAEAGEPARHLEVRGLTRRAHGVSTKNRKTSCSIGATSVRAYPARSAYARIVAGRSSAPVAAEPGWERPTGRQCSTLDAASSRSMSLPPGANSSSARSSTRPRRHRPAAGPHVRRPATRPGAPGRAAPRSRTRRRRSPAPGARRRRPPRSAPGRPLPRPPRWPGRPSPTRRRSRRRGRGGPGTPWRARSTTSRRRSPDRGRARPAGKEVGDAGQRRHPLLRQLAEVPGPVEQPLTQPDVVAVGAERDAATGPVDLREVADHRADAAHQQRHRAGVERRLRVGQARGLLGVEPVDTDVRVAAARPP